ncbi:uncharacterized protein LOC141900883 [Tubulanus polymorphus]|uniref:uncharacterized protein LOC141900883 n=1 Tax=Tubulanus polymorphus TaxID=672921 RepID=UPI003DA1DE7D
MHLPFWSVCYESLEYRLFIKANSVVYSSTVAAFLVDNRYLNAVDEVFVENVADDVQSFNDNVVNDPERVLIFPAVDNYHRLLIHRTVEKFPDLKSFSIGQGHQRRTVVCSSSKHQQFEESMSDKHSQCDQHEGESASQKESSESKYRPPRHSSSRNRNDSSSPRGCTSPAAGCSSSPRGCTSPAAGCSSSKVVTGTTGSSHSPTPISGEPAQQANEKKRARVKPRRPDQQVYVPRGRRMEISAQQTSSDTVPNTETVVPPSACAGRDRDSVSSVNTTTVSGELVEASREQTQRQRPEIPVYVPRGRRMQQLMILADNENNENLVKSQEREAEEAAQISASRSIAETSPLRDDLQTEMTDVEVYLEARDSPSNDGDAYHSCSDHLTGGSTHEDQHRSSNASSSGNSEEPSKPKKKKSSSDPHKLRKGSSKNSGKDGTKRKKSDKKKSSSNSNLMAVDVVSDVSNSVNKNKAGEIDALKNDVDRQKEMDTDRKQYEIAAFSNKFVQGATDGYKDLFDDNNRLAFENDLSYREDDSVGSSQMTPSETSYVSANESMNTSGDIVAMNTSSDIVAMNTSSDIVVDKLIVENQRGSCCAIEKRDEMPRVACVYDINFSKEFAPAVSKESAIAQTSSDHGASVKYNQTESEADESTSIHNISRTARVETDMNSNNMNTDASSETCAKESEIKSSAENRSEIVSNLMNGINDAATAAAAAETTKTSDIDDEDSWDRMFNDEGEALDPNFVDELTKAVGKVKVQKTKCKYLEFQPKEPDMDYEAYNHLIEIADFPPGFVNRDILAAFKDYVKKGFDIKWVDDTHAIGIFSSSIAAKDALEMNHPMLNVLPLSKATRQTKMKAKRCTEFLQPYKARPETTALTARRMVTGALGIAPKVSRELRDQERKKLKEAKEKKKLAVKQRNDAWEGTIGNCAMDEV